jgi:hypothetical protein
MMTLFIISSLLGKTHGSQANLRRRLPSLGPCGTKDVVVNDWCQKNHSKKVADYFSFAMVLQNIYSPTFVNIQKHKRFCMWATNSFY